MKIQLLAAGAALGLMAAVSSASAYTVDDAYWGASNHGYGDVISSTSQRSIFDIQGADANLSGTQLTVKIYTGFAGHAGFDQNLARPNGIGYGDLFLSTGWSPHGSAADHYQSDNAANGNHWTYAFALDDAFASGGNGVVYALGAGTAGNYNPDALLTQDFMTGGTYRNGQAVAADTDGLTQVANGLWDVGDGFLSFTFDITGLNLDPHNLGFHWAMYCANDAIEGLIDVPEPSSGGLALLALGLVGLGFARQRKMARIRG